MIYDDNHSDNSWGPGDILPVQDDHHELLTATFQSMQSSVTEHLSVVCSKLDAISTRMEALEAMQKTMENDLVLPSALALLFLGRGKE